MRAPHPIRVVVTDDLRRSRLTVFFRPILAIPHIIWLALWSAAALVVWVLDWIGTLAAGRSPTQFHHFLAAFVRYATHVVAYLYLTANPFPGFTGTAGSYPVDLEIDPPLPQSRWKTLFRIVLVIPAALLTSALVGSFSTGRPHGGRGAAEAGGAAAVAILIWFYALVTGRAPRGLRDFTAYALRYGAQTAGYLLLLTDRYPYTGPDAFASEADEDQPVGLTVEDDLRRSRLTVFFRLLLAVPHFVWLLLWGVAAFVAAIANWVAALVRGEPAHGLHRFLASYLRYATTVDAYLLLIANPFPGFTGAAGAYPIDVELPQPARQSRWTIGFRIVLALPAIVVAGAIGRAAEVGAVLAWFVSLATGRAPEGIRNLGVYWLRYQAQTWGYVLLLTDRYPHGSPP